jgi:hypothetical protein
MSDDFKSFFMLNESLEKKVKKINLPTEIIVEITLKKLGKTQIGMKLNKDSTENEFLYVSEHKFIDFEIIIMLDHENCIKEIEFSSVVFKGKEEDEIETKPDDVVFKISEPITSLKDTFDVLKIAFNKQPTITIKSIK